MADGDGSTIEQRVARAADAALAERKYVTAIDVLIGVGWLDPRRVDDWRQGRIGCLEEAVAVQPERVSTAIAAFRRWARAEGLEPSELEYVARSRDRRQLQFSKTGDPQIEVTYRTHWVSPELSEAKRARLAERQSQPPDLVVVDALNGWTCSLCSTESAGLLIMEDSGPACMTCADMDHLVFLPSGDAAMTRRAKAASRLAAVVVRFSRARKRYERQGILIEEQALEQAEAQCLEDEEIRARRRERDADRRAGEDRELQARMAAEINRLFPGCPTERAESIARHAAQRGSGRVGRSAAGRALDHHALELAVTASVRHQDTSYDELLMSGVDRDIARSRIRGGVDATLDRWRRP